MFSTANDKPVPNSDKKENRHLGSQPLFYFKKLNYRKLMNQPYHRIKAGHQSQVKTECLLNYDFLMAKIIGCGVR